MHDAADERLIKLCKLASEEQDAAKLLVLVKEINRLLDERVDLFKSRAIEGKPFNGSS